MKKAQLYIFVLGLLSLASCTDDYLDAEPIIDPTDETYYNTPQEAYTALVGCYDGMQVASGGIGGLSFPVASEVLSDNCYGGTGNSDNFAFQAVDEFDISRAPGQANMYESLWSAYYAGIFRCNTLLGKLDDVEWGDDSNLRPVYESETRYIRAQMYFEMVRFWGNIPLLTEPSVENVPQAAPEEVYKVIAEDLVFAANNLPDSPYTSVEAGRVTRWAAKAMLARVYLYYTGYYGQSDLVGIVSKSEALQHVEDVIASSGHALVDDFSTLWPAASVENYAGEDNQEIVFNIKHTYTSDYNGNVDGNHWMIMFGMREFTAYPYYQGWGVTVNDKLWNAYSEEDSRRSASITGVEEEELGFDKIGSQREYTGYYNKKYSPMSDEDGNSVTVGVGGTDFQIGQFQDYTVMRYSDVLLMAAELGSGNAQAYFDQVRKRALGDSFTSIALTPDNLLKERQLEFALEGVRYWDVLRQGISEASNILSVSTTLLNGGVETQKTISASNVEKTKGLQQIPNNQINLSNGVLIQNEGW